MENVRIYATIPLDMKRKLDEKLEGGKVKLSELIYVALYQYLNPSLVNPEAAVLTQKDLDALKNLLNSQPVVPMSYPTNELKPLVNPENPGLVIPDSSPKAEVDPDIKQAFSISSIKAGPGVPQRLRALGIEPSDVIRAKRARSRGSVDNMELEKYFDLV